jgi:hypothetical protein
MSTSNIQPAELDYDTGDNGQPGLPKMPTNILGLIGGHMNPPMPDVTDPNFGNADGFQDAEGKVDDSQSKLTDAITQVQSLESACRTQAQTKILGTISNEGNTFTSDGCAVVLNQCTSPSNVISSTSTVLTGLDSSLDGLSDAYQSLAGTTAPCTSLTNAQTACTTNCGSSSLFGTAGFNCDGMAVPATQLAAGVTTTTPGYSECSSAYTAYQKLKGQQGDTSLVSQCNTIQSGIDRNDKLLQKIGSSTGTNQSGSTLNAPTP